MGTIIYLAEHQDNFKKIEPLIREVCRCAGADKTLTDEIIIEYKSYLQQLATINQQDSQSASLNHACHIILGLLIKAKLKP